MICLPTEAHGTNINTIHLNTIVYLMELMSQDLLFFSRMTRWGEFDDLHHISELDRTQFPTSKEIKSQEGQCQTVIMEETLKHES